MHISTIPWKHPISVLFPIGHVIILSFIPPCMPHHPLPLNKAQAEPLQAFEWFLQQPINQWPCRRGLWYFLLFYRVCMYKCGLLLFLSCLCLYTGQPLTRCPYIPSIFIPFTSHISFVSAHPSSLLYRIRKATCQIIYMLKSCSNLVYLYCFRCIINVLLTCFTNAYGSGCSRVTPGRLTVHCYGKFVVVNTIGSKVSLETGKLHFSKALGMRHPGSPY